MNSIYSKKASLYISIVFCLIGNTSLFAQNYDSLRNVLKGSLPDSVRFDILMEVGNYLETNYPDSAINFHKNAFTLAQKSKDDFKISYVYKELGGDHYYSSDYEAALELYYKALRIATDNLAKNGIPESRRIMFKKVKAATLGNIGVVYFYQGLHTKAAESYFGAMKVNEELGRKVLQAENISNIGAIYYAQGDFDKALEYFSKALVLNRIIGDKSNQAINLMNIGTVHFDRRKYDLALEYYLQAQKIDDELGGGVLTNNYCNIGNVYNKKGDDKKALEYYNRGLKLDEDLDNKPGECVSLINIGALYMKQKHFAEAERYMNKSFKIANELHLLDNMKEAHQNLSELYEAMGNTNLAFRHYKQFILYRDSLKNEENTRKTIQQEFKYNYEKKFAADSLLFAKEKEVREAEIAIKNAEIKVKRNQQYALFGGLALVIVFSGFLYNRFRLTQKQKTIIEEQKELVEEKQREILDSIQYAKRIQKSLLPTEKYIERVLNK